MEVIILAGGFGTRLKSVVPDLPKPMAPVANRPFLTYIFEYLKKQGVTRAILSTGYKHEVIHSFFGESYKGISIDYSVEYEPLGTGGAIKKALDLVNNDQAFVLNGDTFFDVNLMELLKFHLGYKADLTLSLKTMEEFDRYGVVLTSDDKVIRFEEKRYVPVGNINGGVYLVNRNLFDDKIWPDKFSFEADFLERDFGRQSFYGFISDGYFIDIGIPSDFEKAQLELPRIYEE
ncbi:nucleotidyltransferase family protein [Ammoniphilus resinae]|uniref:D-glycero-alpha-D-manno-heptose 1-phosphate guanylyltransferase n=1 Tax=Ammoniphilus resinae TaxID=861532 RepID=A0ABS4GXD9_9BACL|nr:nucleotidyltransferase family protein [Ammoniphilus resinae]MBP1934767.1 D-glycero-alpha-D-manno-heptose 1-phosphate guanylyltransferase [Ammoniphilus resinae]